MEKFSAIRARYREGQHLLAENALQQGKQRFIRARMLFWASFGLVMAFVSEFQHRRQQPLLDGWNLAFLLCVPLLFGFFGYLSAHWKWKDYERIAKS
jgi:hypothetical protein